MPSPRRRLEGPLVRIIRTKGPFNGSPRLRSLRVRLTAVVTVAVGVALAVASVALVTTLSRSLIGKITDAANSKVDSVAESLAQGQPVPDQPGSLVEQVVMIQIQDEQGNVVQTVPNVEGREGATLDRAPDDDLIVASRTVSTPSGTRTVVAASRFGPITQSVDFVTNSLVVATPLLTIFVGVLTWFAVDRALRPIEAVRRRAEAISHSTLDERLPKPKTGDEVERLTTTLNDMLDRLDEGSRRQREFVSDASHELRTPLAAMRADLEVSLTSRNGTDWPALARRLLNDHRRLEGLTSDLLMLARLDDAPGRAETVRLDEIVAGELPAVRHAEVTAALEPLGITGVVPELIRLVRNLLDNADRYAAAQVQVWLTLRNDTVVFTVDDDGPGVPVEQRDRVFDRFFRLDRSRDRASGGAGLGLAMVRRIAEGHGGEVTIATAPLGGARFEVRLPVHDSARSKVV